MIFITGCNGLIGSFVARKLISRNYYIRALRRPESDLSLLQDVMHKIEWVEGDVTDIKVLEKCMKDVDIVIHSAAIVSFAPSEKRKMLQVNIEGTSNVVNTALQNGVKKIIHLSSVAALGRKKNNPLVTEETYWENSEHNTNYAISKYNAELEVWRGFEEGLNGFIVNPSVVLGPGNWNGGSTKLFKYAWEENLFFSGGEMNFIDVRDVAEIICRLLEEEKGNHQRFILNGARLPYKEVFRHMAAEFGKKPPSIEAGPVLTWIAWRAEAIKAVITGKNPLITKETARLSRNLYTYDNSKIRELLHYEFVRPEDTFRWVCRELLKRYNV